ncbi:MAG: YqgE/AlgH family protein [Motiliproteus sp.]|nr:YqgE/AlgH family protein [Motiliproteus sp.]MCW9050840.1 YqgE/AlgH family protein [Motiliproteus sp.]
MSDINLRNQFLLSMPSMVDKNFDHTLTYICDHSEQGAMGIVINRPMDLSVKDILGHLELDTEDMLDPEMPVYSGGPVQGERGFVLHSPTQRPWSSTLPVDNDICLSTSLDVLESIALGHGPQRYLIALGYAGWGEGQLEEEIARNAWLSCPADLDIIFATEASERLDAAASLLGIKLDLLPSEPGHA